MDRAIDSIISGDLNSASLLMLFIIGILTKRFVPWWIHEEVLERLEEYEDAAPALLDEVTTLITLLNDPHVKKTIDEQAPNARRSVQVTRRTKELEKVTQKRASSRPRKRSR